MAMEELAWEPMRATFSEVLDRDMDGLHILPLSMTPLESSSLRQLKMIKNHQLESVIEVFSMRRKASLQVEVANVGKLFDWSDDEHYADLDLLNAIGKLPSFDIYSLRYMLRARGHDVNAEPTLKLSDAKSAELSEYIIVFTRPLISSIYGGENVEINKPGDLIGLFQDPDRAKVRRRLELMARELDIEMVAVPAFLENYGDILLSLAFYKQCLDEVTPIVTEFLGMMDVVRSNQMTRKQDDLMAICVAVEGEVNELTSTIAQRFAELDLVSRNIRDNNLAKGFKDLEAKIREHHRSIGGVLCGLTVKMGIWEGMFPDTESASPSKIADFIKFHMKQGLESMREVQVESFDWH